MAARIIKYLLLCFWFTAVARAQEPPKPLACVERYYSAKAVLVDGEWSALLPDGSRIPYDDKLDKNSDQQLARPDIQDMFATPYPRGAKTAENPLRDPGRVRVSALFKATYPASDLIAVVFVGHRVTVHKKIAPALSRVSARLRAILRKYPELSRYFTKLGGTLANRRVAGEARTSPHAYGIAVDINPELSLYWRWQSDRGAARGRAQTPPPIVEAFEAEGFVWGGRWRHYDDMHFEYRPELLDEACYP